MNDSNFQKGFSLVEILIAIAILAVTALGIFTLLPSGYVRVTKAGRISAMNHLGQQQLDRIRAMTYNDPINLTDGIHPTAGPLRPTYTDTEGNPKNDITVHWEVEENVPVNNTKTVRVYVGWMIYETGYTKMSTDKAREPSMHYFETTISQ